MKNASQTRLPGSIRILCEAAPEYGVSPDQCLEGTGLMPFDLYNNDTQVSISQELATITNFLNHTSYRPGMGIDIGRRYRPEIFGVWGYAILSSKTLRGCLQIATDFANLSFVIAALGLDETREHPMLTFDTTGLATHVKSFVLERHLTVLDNFAQMLLPEWSIQENPFKTTLTDVEFADVVHEKLGYQVQLGETVDAVVLSSQLLDLPLPKYDPKILAECVQHCLEQCGNLLNSHQTESLSWTTRVRDAAMPEIYENPHIQTVAAQLGVSERTLRRRLSEEATSFRQILVDARLAVAHELLKTTNLNVSAVAWRSGYAEPSSFVRAFSRSFGYPPGALTAQRS